MDQHIPNKRALLDDFKKFIEENEIVILFKEKRLARRASTTWNYPIHNDSFMNYKITNTCWGRIYPHHREILESLQEDNHGTPKFNLRTMADELSICNKKGRLFLNNEQLGGYLTYDSKFKEYNGTKYTDTKNTGTRYNDIGNTNQKIECEITSVLEISSERDIQHRERMFQDGPHNFSRRHNKLLRQMSLSSSGEDRKKYYLGSCGGDLAIVITQHFDKDKVEN